MNFITPAFAQTSGLTANGQWDILFLMATMVAIIYFVVIRPQQKKMKETQEMLLKIRRGDIIVTSGGIIGKVTRAVEGADLEVEIATDVRVKLVRSMVMEVRAKSVPVKESGAAPTPSKDA